MFADNKSVDTSATIPHSLLSKRHNILSYHRVKEAIAAKIVSFYWCDSTKNKSDIVSKLGQLQSLPYHIQELFNYQGKINLGLVLEINPQDSHHPMCMNMKICTLTATINEFVTFIT